MIISLTIQTLGAGFLYTTRSVITTMIQRDQTARFYTVIEITQVFGMILAGPVMTFVFQWGLHIEGIWLGLHGCWLPPCLPSWLWLFYGV